MKCIRRIVTVAVLAAALQLTAAGCREDEARVYDVPKEPGGSPAPAGGGPVAFEVRYTLPAGWAADPTPRAMREATFIAGQPPDAAQVYISRAGGDLMSNLAMWRAQLGLPPVAPDQAMGLITHAPTADGTAVLVDLSADSSGPGAATRPDESSPPGPLAHGSTGDGAIGRIIVAIIAAPDDNMFVKMQGSESAVARHRDELLAFVGSIRLVQLGPGGGMMREGQAGPTDPTGPGFACELPEGWSADPVPSPGVLASYTAGAVKVTASSLPGDGGGLLANVNRWRGKQLGLAEVGALADQPMNAVTVDGQAGTVVDLLGAADGREPLRIVAATVPRGGSTWFFKMTGPPEPVGAQRPAFDRFLRSVRFGRPQAR